MSDIFIGKVTYCYTNKTVQISNSIHCIQTHPFLPALPKPCTGSIHISMYIIWGMEGGNKDVGLITTKTLFL